LWLKAKIKAYVAAWKKMMAAVLEDIDVSS